MINFFKRLFGSDDSSKKGGVVAEKGGAMAEKEEERYFFFDYRCSFKLDKDGIKSDVEEGCGLKHTLTTESMSQIVIEILPFIPESVAQQATDVLDVNGHPCVLLPRKTPEGVHVINFIQCDSFVVRVELSNYNTMKEQDFLNSFRIERVIPKSQDSDGVNYEEVLKTVVFEYYENKHNRKPSFSFNKNTYFGPNLRLDWFDMASIINAFEKRSSLQMLPDHPINNMSAYDTNYSVEYLLSAYGIVCRPIVSINSY